MSSDSEDDCYGNVAQQLQKLKNQYTEDKIESLQLLNDSNELDEIVKSNPLPATNKRKSTSKSKNDTSATSVSDFNVNLPDNNSGNSNRRTTRSSARNSSITPQVSEELPPKRARRKNNTRGTSLDASTDSPDTNSTTNDTPSVPSPSNTTRGRRGRGRANTRARGRQRGRRRNAFELLNWFVNTHSTDSAIPTYSVGNTEEYPDQSDSQALFSNKSTPKTSDVVLIDDAEEENEELNVKVYWTSSEYYKFPIRRFQKITQIFDYFSRKESLSFDKLLFRYNGRILKPDDTPDSIGYVISKIIDGGIVETGVSDLIKRKEVLTDGIKLKFQCQNMKKPLELIVRPSDKFSLTMVKVAEHLEKPLDKLKFEFDGDSISGKSTAAELDLEGGECIDVKVIS